MIAILSMGLDRSLMAIRAMLLQQAGYAVTQAWSSEQALRRLRSSAFDLMLVCHTVPQDEVKELIAAVRLLQPGLQIVYISATEHHPAQEHCASVSNLAPAFLTELSAVLRKTGSGRTL